MPLLMQLPCIIHSCRLASAATTYHPIHVGLQLPVSFTHVGLLLQLPCIIHSCRLATGDAALSAAAMYDPLTYPVTVTSVHPVYAAALASQSLASACWKTQTAKMKFLEETERRPKSFPEWSVIALTVRSAAQTPSHLCCHSAILWSTLPAVPCTTCHMQHDFHF